MWRRFLARPLPAAMVASLLVAVPLTAASAPPHAVLPVVGSAKGAEAQSPFGLPADLAPGDVERFAATLTDRDARELLIVALRERAQAAAPVPGRDEAVTFEGIVGRLHQRHERLEARLAEAGRELAALPQHGEVMLRNLTDQEGWPAVGHGLLVLVVLVGAGATLEFLYHLLSRDICNTLCAIPVSTTGGRVGAAAIQFLLDAVGLGVFALTTYAASFLFFERFNPLRFLIMSIAIVVVVTRAALIVMRVFFSSPSGGQPLVPMAAEAGRRFTAWIVAGVTLIAVNQVGGELLVILGLPEVLAALYRVVGGSAIAFLALVLIWRRRALFAALVGGNTAADAAPLAAAPVEAAPEPRRTLGAVLAASWPALAMVYVVILWITFAEGKLIGHETFSLAAPLSLALIIFAPFLDWLLRQFLDERARVQRDEAGATEAMIGRRPLHALILLLARLGLAGLALGLLAEGWGLGLVGWLATPSGAAVGQAAAQIAVTLALAALAWALVKRLIDRLLAAEKRATDTQQRAGDDEGGSMVAKSRGETLVPLLRTTAFVALAVLVAMIVLSALGLDIGPLLAGAGVIGIAIGFGAQALVRDILAGIFFLIDDAFRIGEYIEISNELRGEVERISIRSMQLRHHRGMLLTLPFGELRSIINHNRDWAIYKQEFRVPYDTDLEKVRKIIKKLGQELMTDPEYGPKLLEPLKSQGVLRIEESALIVRTKFKCKPREQFVLRRVVFQRVRDALAANGIALAHRTVNVTLPATQGAVSPAVAASAAAAGGAVIAGEQAAKAAARGLG